jgi:LysM repeat protein
MNMQRLTLALMAAILMTTGHFGHAQTLKGSRASMERQNQIAIKQGYTFVKTSKVVNGLVDAGDLVEVRNSRDFELHDVSYPYARPAVKAFIERLSSNYRVACGEKLTVTSLTRPIDRQPANASSDSVHPTGMAVDLRIPSKQSCRTWLENYLLDMERDDVLDVTRERRPPHYHVAVFPNTYEQYVADLSTSTQEYTVRRGDTLSRIATSTGTSVAQLRASNGLRNDVLQIGQKLLVRAAENPSQVIATVAASSASAPVLAVTETTTQVVVPTVSTHRVKRGETLSKIAALTGTTVDELRAANGLRGDVIQVGQELLLRSAGTNTQVAAAVVSTHRVKRGETLWRIARLYDTTTDALAAKNNLASDILQVGQTLTIE